VRNRTGFSLVETLIALVIFEFAMLALAAGAAVAARDLAGARRAALAHAMARNRVDRLAAVACPGPGSGSLGANGFTEHWNIQAAGRRRLISDSVVFARPGGVDGFVIARAAALCVP
jgi:Tfp pilus assembly protein PilV